MLKTKEVEVKWSYQTREYYESKGYVFTKYRDTFICKVEDLSSGSHVRVDYTCDYCGKDLNAKYQDYYNGHNKTEIHKDCCSKCQQLKTKECNMIKYGVENTSQLDSVKEKIKNTFLINYGVDHPFKTKEIVEKSKKTCIEKYGVDNPSKSAEILDKIKQAQFEKYGGWYSSTEEYKDRYKRTSLVKYGFEHPTKSKYVLDKMKKTCIKKYGVDNINKDKDFFNEKMKRMAERGIVNTSKQQIYLHNLYGGKINYIDETTGSYVLDIAFPEEKIYCEYNGGFHDGAVKTGQITQKQFEKRELDRYFFLKRNGWKMFKIDSKKDYIPSDEILLKELEIAKKWLSVNEKGHGHYDMILSTHVNDENYGHLRKITDKDIKL